MIFVRTHVVLVFHIACFTVLQCVHLLVEISPLILFRDLLGHPNVEDSITKTTQKRKKGTVLYSFWMRHLLPSHDRAVSTWFTSFSPHISDPFVDFLFLKKYMCVYQCACVYVCSCVCMCTCVCVSMCRSQRTTSADILRGIIQLLGSSSLIGF